MPTFTAPTGTCTSPGTSLGSATGRVPDEHRDFRRLALLALALSHPRFHDGPGSRGSQLDSPDLQSRSHPGGSTAGGVCQDRVVRARDTSLRRGWLLDRVREGRALVRLAGGGGARPSRRLCPIPRGSGRRPGGPVPARPDRSGEPLLREFDLRVAALAPTQGRCVPRDHASGRRCRPGDRDRRRDRIWNDRGAFAAAAVVDDAARPGVAFTYKVQWPKLSPRGSNVNATTPERDADLGGSPTFHDNRVEIELARKPRRKAKRAAADQAAKARRGRQPAMQGPQGGGPRSG